VLGSYTELGNVSAAGTLNSANGIVLNFGRNLVGWGTVNSTNTLARARQPVRPLQRHAARIVHQLQLPAAVGGPLLGYQPALLQRHRPNLARPRTRNAWLARGDSDARSSTSSMTNVLTGLAER
jgi:hypothetical protein